MGVNKYRLEKEEEVDVLSIDNSRVIAVQVHKSLCLLNIQASLLCPNVDVTQTMNLSLCVP